jgi:S1-C subfamily serine protease
MHRSSLSLHRVFLGLVLSLTLIGSAQANAEVQERVLRSTGYILVPKGENQVGIGSCWVVDQERRWVITNSHVVGDADKAVVFFPQFREGQPIRNSAHYVNGIKPSKGQVIGKDPKRDLALVELSFLPEGVQALPIADRNLAEGSAVFSIGNSGANGKPLDAGTLWTLKTGQTRGTQFMDMTSDTGLVSARLITIDYSTTPGDSGGPLVDEAGELVGVVALYNKKNDKESWCIHAGEVREFLDNIARRDRQEQDAVNPLVGFWRVTRADNKSFGFLSTIRADGTCGTRSFDEKIVLSGNYRFAEENLTLELNQGRVRPSGKVQWLDADRFTVTFSDGDWVFERR